MNMTECFPLLLLLACTGILAHAQVSTQKPLRPGSTCTSHMIASSQFQICVSILGNINASLLTHNEICRYYSEAVYCTKRDIDNKGGSCNLADIEYMVHLMTFIDPKLYTGCKVTNEPGSMCSEVRLAVFSLTSCRPFVAEMASYPDSHCMLLDYLLSCTKRYLSNVQTICTDAQLESALVSNTAEAWMQRHFPSMDLRQCFSGFGNPITTVTTPPTTTPPCVKPLNVFGNRDVLSCLSFLLNVKHTGNDSISTTEECSLINEALVCMVGKLGNSGYHCSLQQTHDTLVAMLNIGDLLGSGWSAVEHVGQCKVNSTYATMPLCSDSHRLVTFLINTLSSIFSLVESYNNQALKCTTLLSSSRVVLDGISTNCTSSEIWTVLTSAYGQSQLSLHYPKLDVKSCYTSSGAALDDSTESDYSRQKYPTGR